MYFTDNSTIKDFALTNLYIVGNTTLPDHLFPLLQYMSDSIACPQLCLFGLFCVVICICTAVDVIVRVCLIISSKIPIHVLLSYFMKICMDILQCLQEGNPLVNINMADTE